MTIIKLDTTVGHWTAVPVSAAENLALSLEARGLLLWFLVKPPNWRVDVMLAREALGLSEFLWGRLTRQLKNQGYYFVRESRDKWGRIGKEIIITPTPQKFGVGHQPQICQGLVDLGVTNKKERNSFNKNNNNLEVVVVRDVLIEEDLFEKGMLSKTERDQVLVLLQNCDHPQKIMDELVGAIRKRGRGEKGVRTPALFVKKILTVPADQLYLAVEESELRQARHTARQRENTPITLKKEVRPVDVRNPPPKEFFDFVKKIKGAIA